MKKLLYLLTSLCLLAGTFTACEKPNATSEENGGSPKENYTETAFGMNLEMVYVDGGTFEMGATAEQGDDAGDDEKPVRKIKLDGYHIGKYEVTQEQWKAVMGTIPYLIPGDNLPVTEISWDDAQEFCKRLSETTGKKYVLPTEAQWEYAARGGNKSQHYKYAGSNDVDEVAWYEDNSCGLGWDHPDYGKHPIGTKKANELGIYDMSGNVSEYCFDWYADKYDENDTDNPQGPASGSNRVFRGGDWIMGAFNCRVAHRDDGEPEGVNHPVGFRVAVLP